TNDDLVQEAKVDELYDFELIYEGETTATIRAVPKPDAAVVWGRIDYELRIADPLPLRARYYDEDGELVRILRFEDVRRIAGREIPMRIVVLPQDKPDERTEFVYESIEFDVPLPKNLFSLTALRRR
ncbi:MAG: outer membrane lipoprotein-sorting protein, partial [Candidatus Dadabacteria bacterium]